MTQSTHSLPLDGDRIARELAALGEPAPSAEELRFVRGEHEDVDVATVGTLVKLADPAALAAVDEGLSPFSRRRVWNHVEARMSQAWAAHSSAESPAPPSSHGRITRTVITGLAVAAGVALMARLTPAEPAGATDPEAQAASRAAVESLGEQARRSVESLEGPTGGARAEALAEQYAARLREGAAQ